MPNPTDTSHADSSQWLPQLFTMLRQSLQMLPTPIAPNGSHDLSPCSGNPHRCFPHQHRWLPGHALSCASRPTIKIFSVPGKSCSQYWVGPGECLDWHNLGDRSKGCTISSMEEQWSSWVKHMHRAFPGFPCGLSHPHVYKSGDFVVL